MSISPPERNSGGNLSEDVTESSKPAPRAMFNGELTRQYVLNTQIINKYEFYNKDVPP